MNSIICKILVTSDIHGHIYPTDYRGHEEVQLGLAKLGTIIKQERSKSPDLILVDNGDLIQGTPLSSYYIKHGQGEGATHPAVQVLNELNYDAAVPGNHEFNYGMDVLCNTVEQSQFPWLSAGILDSESGEPVFGKPYIVIERADGIKVAILGVTTHYIPHWEHPGHIQGLEFRDALETVKAWVPRIRESEQPDLLIVSYHGGFECDLVTGDAAERLTGENQGYAICREVPGIDVLITGHQHRMIASEVNGVTVIQPGSNGRAIGKIEVRFEKESGAGTDTGGAGSPTWKIIHKHAELMSPDETVVADPVILQMVSDIEEQTQRWLDQPIGQVEGDMSIRSVMACRLADHPFIELVNKVQMEAAGVAISNTALLNNESRGFSGTLTLRDVLTNFMYPNTLTVLRLTGRDIREALEQTANYFQVDDAGRPCVNPAYLEPKAQHYNYDMWEGIQYELDISKKVGERVVRLEYSGAPMEDEAEFDVVMNNYRAGGGGDYEMFRGRPVIREVQTDMSELVADYIMRKGTISAECDHNWRVTGYGKD